MKSHFPLPTPGGRELISLERGEIPPVDIKEKDRRGQAETIRQALEKNKIISCKGKVISCEV